jgi:hypothetical protein
MSAATNKRGNKNNSPNHPILAAAPPTQNGREVLSISHKATYNFLVTISKSFDHRAFD